MAPNETEILIRQNENQYDFPDHRGLTSESCHRALRIEILSPQPGDIIFLTVFKMNLEIYRE
jgi:hypothetical protein